MERDQIWHQINLLNDFEILSLYYALWFNVKSKCVYLEFYICPYKWSPLNCIPYERLFLSHSRHHRVTLSSSPEKNISPPLQILITGDNTDRFFCRRNLSQQPQYKGSKVSVRKLASRLQKSPPLPQDQGSSAERFSYQMESITKWDLGSLKTYYSVEPHDKSQEDEYPNVNLVPRLQAELWKAQSRIKELEIENFESEEKIKYLIRNERKYREDNTDPLIDYLKEKLSKERKERKVVYAENSKLKKKILHLESTASRLRRERDTMEKVCEELVIRINELKAETRRVWEETEEERQMLHMAEMLREERVRVKLMDAKIALQEKYEEMNWFVKELEKCLEMAREVEGIEEMGLIKGEGLIKTARSMKAAFNTMDFERFEFLSEEDN